MLRRFMKKWRIVRYGDSFFVEHRVMGFLWWSSKAGDGYHIYFLSLEKARDYIDMINKQDEPIEREVIEYH